MLKYKSVRIGKLSLAIFKKTTSFNKYNKRA